MFLVGFCLHLQSTLDEVFTRVERRYRQNKRFLFLFTTGIHIKHSFIYRGINHTYPVFIKIRVEAECLNLGELANSK